MSDQNDFFDDLVNDEPEPDAELAMEFDDDDEDDEDEDEEFSEVRTVVMSKNDMVALLSLRVSPSGAQIVRVDPRQSLPSAQHYDDTEAAAQWFSRSLATSRKNGWVVVYDGEPIFG